MLPIRDEGGSPRPTPALIPTEEEMYFIDPYRLDQVLAHERALLAKERKASTVKAAA